MKVNYLSKFLSAKSRIRTKIGQSLIEVCVGIVVAVPVILVAVDLGVLLLGVEQNDNACRNAVRAAAAGAPSDASSRAEAIVSSSSSENRSAMITSSQLVLPVAVNIVSQPKSEIDFAAEKQTSPGGPVIGTTTVTTEISVRPILIHMLYGGKTPLTFRATHSFPIIYSMPAS